MIDLVCRVNLNQSLHTCAHLNETADVRLEVQRTSSMLSMAQSVLASVPGIFLCLLIGPWSDDNGRKPLMILPLVGMVVQQVSRISGAGYKM